MRPTRPRALARPRRARPDPGGPGRTWRSASFVADGGPSLAGRRYVEAWRRDPAYHPGMPVLRSRLDPGAAETRANHDAMAALVEDLRARQAALAAGGAGGDERSIARHRERGKLPVRERIDRLLDPGSSFLELSPLAANGLYDDDAPGAGIVTGIGRIEGTTCVVVANDATVKGGTYYPMTVKKHLRAQEIALENRLPCVYLVDSRRRLPPAPGRGLPGPRPLRADLLQPGAHVGRRHPAGRPGHGLLHGRRRLRPGDERRDGHRPRDRDDLPRRPAAGEGRHRRGRDRRRSSVGRRSTPAGPASPITRRSTTSTPWRSGARSSAT